MTFLVRLLPVLFVLLILPVGGTALAHPEDELCGVDSSMDPALCRELLKLDRSDTSLQSVSYGGTSLEAVRVDRSFWDTFRLYVELGFIHIVPKGYDHILFVLALFLGARNWRSLLLQVSVFTVAHTLTLGLAAAGWVSVPAGIIEPLIALSIALVAIENILFSHMTKWRPLLVFGFGLFHGLGFAGVLGELGLVRDQFLTSLIGFNIGVEIGQIAVISMAALATFLAMRLMTALADSSTAERGHQRFIIQGGSLIIAFFGLYWFLNRTLSGF